MKKTLCLFGATIIASAIFTSCSKEEAAPRNYYGTQPAETQGTQKEAYYAFFGGLVVIVILVLWLLKKLGGKK
jgi:hypothetical protein